MNVQKSSTGAAMPAITPAPATNITRIHPGGCPTEVEPRVWREQLTTRLESHLAVVTGLLALLDDMDGDPDIEAYLADGVDDDREGDPLDDGELDEADKELSLGWSDHSNQAMIATESTYRVDIEDDPAFYESDLGGHAVMTAIGMVSDCENNDTDHEYSDGVDTAEAPVAEWSPERPDVLVLA